MYAAGDVAEFLNIALQSRIRVEHEDNANTMGKVAGQNMAGARVAYHHQPYFYSDLFELGYEAVGDLDPKLEVVSDWTEPFRQGVVYYLHDEPGARRIALERLGQGRGGAAADCRCRKAATLGLEGSYSTVSGLRCEEVALGKGGDRGDSWRQ